MNEWPINDMQASIQIPASAFGNPSGCSASHHLNRMRKFRTRSTPQMSHMTTSKIILMLEKALATSSRDEPLPSDHESIC
jgi:hypothetical protein